MLKDVPCDDPHFLLSKGALGLSQVTPGDAADKHRRQDRLPASVPISVNKYSGIHVASEKRGHFVPFTEAWGEDGRRRKEGRKRKRRVRRHLRSESCVDGGRVPGLQHGEDLAVGVSLSSSPPAACCHHRKPLSLVQKPSRDRKQSTVTEAATKASWQLSIERMPLPGQGASVTPQGCVLPGAIGKQLPQGLPSGTAGGRAGRARRLRDNAGSACQ